MLCHLVPRTEDLRRENLGPKKGLEDGFNCGLTVQPGSLMSKKEFHSKILTFYTRYFNGFICNTFQHKKILGYIEKEIGVERIEGRDRG